MSSTKLFNLVEMTVLGAPGTGTIALGAATAGNRFTFAEAGVANGDVVSYVVRDGSDIEVGIGTYTSSGTTLSRDTVRKSKIAGVAGTSKVSLTSAAIVYIDAAAQDLDVNDFTEDTSPDPAADYWWMHDASAGGKRKVKPSNMALTGLSTYAEGSWTPVLQGATIAGTHSYSAQVGRYIRVGNLVTVWFRIVLTALDGTATGAAQVSGLPFPARAVTGLNFGGNQASVSLIDLAAGQSQFICQIPNNLSLFNIQQVGDNIAGAAVLITAFQNTSIISCAASYPIN